MIICKLNGGLGNQLFQYATARALSLHYHTALQLDTSGYDALHLRSYMLDNFKIEANVASEANLRRYLKKAKIRQRIVRWLPFAAVLPGATLYRESHPGFDPHLFEHGGDIYLDGFWQTEKYFYHYRKELLAELRLKEALCCEPQILAHIHGTMSVGLHIRRGDYVSDDHASRFHGLCSMTYYRRGLEHMQSHLEKFTVFVFSDDIAWARSQFSDLNNVEFVEPSPDSVDALSLYLMSQCQHNIIANSTFSWWAAWLNSNEQSIIIAPQEWNNGPPEAYDDILPDRWITLPRD